MYTSPQQQWQRCGGGGDGGSVVWWGAMAASWRRRRATALRWSCVHGALLALLAADLLAPCGPDGVWRWAEAAAALLLAVALLGQVTAAARALHPPAPPHGPLSPRQLALLGVKPQDIDSSYVSVSSAESVSRDCSDDDQLSLSVLSRATPSPPPSPPSPTALHSYHLEADPTQDEYDLMCYYRQSVSACGGVPQYSVAVLEERAAEGERGEGAAGALQGGGGGAEGPALAWRRLRLEPAHLAQYTLNLRVWLHETIVRRVAHQLEAADTVSALPVPLRAYVSDANEATRVRALAHRGALAEYRWRTDAELLLKLVSAYLDAVAGEFSARHVSRAPAAVGRAPCLHVRRARPLHAAVHAAGELLEPQEGANNLLHCLLLLLCALARSTPPCLNKVHLGPAGLNMLWIIGK